MKILYLSHRIPYPPNKGDKIRSFNEIKYLSQRHEIHLACLADDPKDLKYENELKQYCKAVKVVLINPQLAKLKSIFYLLTKQPLTIPYFYSRKLQQTIDQLLSTNDYDAIFCFSSPMAEYVFKSRVLSPQSMDHRPRTKLIMDFVDVDSDKWAQYAKYTSFPKSWVYRLEGARLAAYEGAVAKAFDHSIFVTKIEEEVFKAKNPNIQNVSVVQNGVDLDYFSPSCLHQESTSDQGLSTMDHRPTTIDHRPVIVFTGAMDYYANIDGVVWFTKEILPLIKKEIPVIQFYIVGSNPTKEVLSLPSNNGVTVTGYVPDTREYLRRATVAVVPLRIARGIQNKILEAMAMGIPVVATPRAFEGIEANPDRDLILGEDVEKIAEGIIKLIKEVSLRKSLSGSGRAVIEKNYCWTKNLEKLNSILAK
jgi:sugar transferase (PEP-CTERM/EpsH1 system associated)